jgi:hypothetical protein
MERDSQNQIPPISDHTTHCATLQSTQKKGRKRQKENYNEKFLIKKVKTRCLKVFMRLVLQCGTKGEKLKLQGDRNMFKLFKSDVCKSRNRAVLSQSIRYLLNLFSNICVEGVSVRRDTALTFAYLMNLSWEDFLLHMKHRSPEFFKSDVELTDPIVEVREISEFFNYIKSETKYKARQIDLNYSNLYTKLNESYGVKSADDMDLQIYIKNHVDN